MRSLDEINRRLAEAEQNLATLNARQAELLWQIAELQQEYVDFEVPLLAKMYARRRAGYKAIGYEIVLPEIKSQATQLALEKL